MCPMALTEVSNSVSAIVYGSLNYSNPFGLNASMLSNLFILLEHINLCLREYITGFLL